MKRLLLFLPALLLLCGCAVTSTVKHTNAAPGDVSASGKRAVAHLEGMNSGGYLFYYIPLWSGKENRPNRRDYDTFEHHLRPRDMRKMLKLYAKRLGADDVEDIKISTASTGVWTLWIFWKRSIHATGTAVESKK